MNRKLLKNVLFLFFLIELVSCNDERLLISESVVENAKFKIGESSSNPQGRSFLGVMDCLSITNLGTTAYVAKGSGTYIPEGPYDDTTNGTGAQLAEVQLQFNGRGVLNAPNPSYLFGQFKVELISSPNVKLVGIYLFGDSGPTYYPIYPWESYSGKTQQIVFGNNIATDGFNGRINVVVSCANNSSTPITLRFTGFEDSSYPSSMAGYATEFNGSTTESINVSATISGATKGKIVRSLDGTTITGIQYSISNGPWVDFNSDVFLIDNSLVKYRATYNNPLYPADRAEYTITAITGGAHYYGYGSQTLTTGLINVTTEWLSVSFASQVGND